MGNFDQTLVGYNTGDTPLVTEALHHYKAQFSLDPQLI